MVVQQWIDPSLHKLLFGFQMSLRKTFKKSQVEVIRHLVLRKMFTEIHIAATLILSEIKDLLSSQGTRDSLF